MSIMSVELRPRTQRQRRLGVLRNSHSPRVRTAPPGAVKSNVIATDLHRNHCSFMDGSIKPIFAAEQLYREKRRRLNQVRTENAAMKVRTQSSYDLQRTSNVIGDAYSLRCSTAPSYGTVRQFLKDKILLSNETGSDSVFEDKQTTHIKFEPRRRTRLATFPTIDHHQNARVSLLYSPTGKEETVYLSKQPSGNVDGKSIPKSALINNSLSKLLRSASAPAEVYRDVHLKEEAIRRTYRCPTRHTYSSLVKHDSKRTIRTPIPHNASSAKSRSASDSQHSTEQGSLGIIGEPCRSNKPPAFVRPLYKLPLRRPGLTIKIPQKVHLNLPEESSSIKNVCVIPHQTNRTPYPSCACRSVRFNCTDNLIHEYLTNDPVVVSKEAKK